MMNPTSPSPSEDRLPKTAFLLFSVVAFVAAVVFLWQEKEKQQLEEQLQQLEISMEQRRKKNLQELDSLQQSVEGQQKLNIQLQDSLNLFQLKREQLNSRTNENKAAIGRIRDIDSLRDVVARRYR